MLIARRRRGLLAILAVIPLVALLVLPGAATSAEQIVIYGNQSGTHLTLTTEAGRIIVKGAMGAAHPRGCHISANRLRAVCPVAGESAIELDMGPGGDFVEVADPMPLPVTAYLGGGSDKMIGNAEVDNCYSQGARRNRCIGGPGNDVCITGEKNSDCVGDAGNDYCETHDGSDGCWGGEGNDVCRMGPGEDGCHGEGGDDRLYGGANPDQLYGGAGYDYCNGGEGRGKSHACEAGPQH